MEFSLHPATAADYAWLWDLKRSTMRGYVEQTWGSWDDVAQEAFFRRTFSAETVQLIMLEGHKAGLLHVERKPDEIFLANIQIHPDFQNRGLGTAVIRTVQESARLLALPLRLQVLTVNIAARDLYLKLGFKISGETATHVIMHWRPPSHEAIRPRPGN